MPVAWSYISEDDTLPPHIGPVANGEKAALIANLSAHNSLGALGFVQFIGITAILMCIPLLAFLGTPFLWIIFGYLALGLSAMWWGLKISWYRGTVQEKLLLWTDHLTLVRTNPDGNVQSFDANPYWTTIQLFKTEGPVPQYLTLSGAGRHVEVGSFLSEDERKALCADLRKLLGQISRGST